MMLQVLTTFSSTSFRESQGWHWSCGPELGLGSTGGWDGLFRFLVYSLSACEFQLKALTAWLPSLAQEIRVLAQDGSSAVDGGVKNRSSLQTPPFPSSYQRPAKLQ